MPSGRISWKVADNVLLWSAVSRAVRAPTPVDEDIHELSGSVEVLGGSRSFEPEVLTAYEAGTRIQLSPRASFSLSGFYNVYDDLRSIEISPTTFLPLSWGNLMTGIVYGAEFWGSYRVTDWWRLSAGFNIQHEHFRFKSGSSQIGGTEFTADDPNHQASLRSSVDLGHGVTWDTDLRYIGKLHDPAVPDYAELDVRLGWQITPSVEVSISGFNLIHDRHQEFNEPGLSTEIPRSYYVQTRLRF
jgi:iron complex outermembrane receptor protein